MYCQHFIARNAKDQKKIMARKIMGLGITFGGYSTHGVLVGKCRVMVRDIYLAACINFDLCMFWNDRQVFIMVVVHFNF